MNDLLVVMPFCAADVGLAMSLMDWIEKLGRCEKFDALLVKDSVTARSVGEELRSRARKSFKNVGLVQTAKTLANERWPIGPNWMFETALKQTRVYNRAFLWLEPDCVPMKRGWLEQINKSYEGCKKPFMGQIVTTGNKLLPEKILSGVAVYPKDAYARLVGRVAGERMVNAFDVATADLSVPEAYHTRLIWNFHGEKGLPPTFVEAKSDGAARNALSMEVIPKATVLFHRCKDSSLQKLLAKKL